MAQAFMVLWWIPATTVPTVAEATARLAQLEALGPTPDAFTFRACFRRRVSRPNGATTIAGPATSCSRATRCVGSSLSL